MAQSIYLVNENSNSYGSIALEMSVFKTIANNVLSEESGVITSKDSYFLKHLNDAVDAHLEDGGLVIDVNVKLAYGTPVSKTAADIQEKICQQVAELTAVYTKAINVNILGIEF